MRHVSSLLIAVALLVAATPAIGQDLDPAPGAAYDHLPAMDRQPVSPVIHHVGSGTGETGTGQFFGGLTCYAGVPTIFYDRSRKIDSLQRAENIRHEAMHFVQLAAGDCVETLGSWIASPRLFLAAEMEAFCTGIGNLPTPVRKRRETEYLLLFGGPRRPYGITFEDVSNEIHRHCEK